MQRLVIINDISCPGGFEDTLHDLRLLHGDPNAFRRDENLGFAIEAYAPE